MQIIWIFLEQLHVLNAGFQYMNKHIYNDFNRSLKKLSRETFSSAAMDK